MKIGVLAIIAVLLLGCARAESQSDFQLESCGDSQDLFSVAPANMDDIVTMTPVGMMTPPGHVFPAPHMYFFVLSPEAPRDVEIPVYASGDMVLKQIGLRHYNKMGKKENYLDYTLVFSPCKGFDLYFHHLRSLTYAPFYDAAQEILEDCSFSEEINEDYCSGGVNIPIRAGVQFATAGDLKAGVGGFDLGARDYRLAEGRSALLNPDKHCYRGQNVFDRCYTVCPLDYFPDELTGKFVYSTGKPDSPDALSCGGNLFFDVKGTAQGYWFGEDPGRNNYGPEHLNAYFGPNTFNPAQSALSVGDSVPGIRPMVYPFTPRHTGLVNRDPDEVTADGNVYCYNGEGRHAQEKIAFLMQLVNETTLRIGRHGERECGSGPWSFSDYADFER